MFKEVQTNIVEYQNNFFSQLDSDLESLFEDGQIALFSLPEVQFTYSVIMPSYLFYGDHALTIFRKAQKGDINSIEKILRLDPSALGDPQIFEHFHFASKQENRSDFETMIHALQSPPKGKIQSQKTKYRLAGMIASLAELISYKLPAPEIERLFTAISIDFKKPEWELVEIDNIYNDSIAKNIRREKRFWNRYFKLDKK